MAEHYRAIRNSIVDSAGKQIAVVLPSNCTMKLAREMAAFAAQQANYDAQRKARTAGVEGKHPHEELLLRVVDNARGVPGTSNDQGEKRGG